MGVPEARLGVTVRQVNVAVTRVDDASANVRRGGIVRRANGVGARSGAAAGLGAACAVSMTPLVRGGPVVGRSLRDIFLLILKQLNVCSAR